MVHLLDGRWEATLLTSKLQEQVQRLKRKGIIPTLAVVLVGDDPASLLYVRKKREKASELGIFTHFVHLKRDTGQDVLNKQLQDLSEDPCIHGILLQLPLPKHLNVLNALCHIVPTKDVDGLHPMNVGLLALGEPAFIPCTPQGCLHLIKLWKKQLAGLNALVIGRSFLVGKPVAQLLLQENCTTTIAHTHTKNLPALCRQADIIVAAAGRKHLVQGDWIKQGACVIDVGINPLTMGITGDVDFEGASKIAGAISPVPGGVGPLTVMFLMHNVMQAAECISREKL